MKSMLPEIVVAFTSAAKQATAAEIARIVVLFMMFMVCLQLFVTTTSESKPYAKMKPIAK